MNPQSADLAAQLAVLRQEFRDSLPGRLAGIERDLATLAAAGATPACPSPPALADLLASAHRLAGAAGTFGMPTLGNAARELESLARQLIAEPERRNPAGLSNLRALFASIRMQAGAATDREAPAP